MAKVQIPLVSTALSKPQSEEVEKAEAVEFPILNEIRIRQKALKPESFSTEKVKVK